MYVLTPSCDIPGALNSSLLLSCLVCPPPSSTSDAVISKTFEESSLNSLLEFMQQKLSWDVNEKPMVFNQVGGGGGVLLSLSWSDQIRADQIRSEWSLHLITLSHSVTHSFTAAVAIYSPIRHVLFTSVLFIGLSASLLSVSLFTHLICSVLFCSVISSSTINPRLSMVYTYICTNHCICVQDGPCWWCKLIKKAGYSMCLNAGTVLWYRHPHSDQVLLDWWQSTMDNYADNPLKRKFRMKWPWEQDRQMALYHRSPQHIQVASHPDFPMLIREHQDPNSVLYQAQAEETNQSTFDGSTMLSDRDRQTNPSVVIKEWCLSHLPGSIQFISTHT